ncbi:MAG: HNH endonuclease [Nocardioides sp.]|nr:HNH endonuclease [Nocardioides sp.]
MRESVVLRDRHCVFPWCTRDARACDLDHIRPYVPMDEGGPPGQTAPANLAPLCRRHHRAKTARRWHYQRHGDGTYTWRGPYGHVYLVTPLGTTPFPPARTHPA